LFLEADVVEYPFTIWIRFQVRCKSNGHGDRREREKDSGVGWIVERSVSDVPRLGGAHLVSLMKKSPRYSEQRWYNSVEKHVASLARRDIA